MDYFVPCADVIRDFVHEMDQSIPCQNNPFSVKGVGELRTIGATPAIVNAVADALAQAGKAVVASNLQMLLTPHVVWTALN
jgi:carbon-monoxide dehydrogenase large subunit